MLASAAAGGKSPERNKKNKDKQAARRWTRNTDGNTDGNAHGHGRLLDMEMNPNSAHGWDTDAPASAHVPIRQHGTSSTSSGSSGTSVSSGSGSSGSSGSSGTTTFCAAGASAAAAASGGGGRMGGIPGLATATQVRQMASTARAVTYGKGRLQGGYADRRSAIGVVPACAPGKGAGKDGKGAGKPGKGKGKSRAPINYAPGVQMVDPMSINYSGSYAEQSAWEDLEALTLMAVDRAEHTYGRKLTVSEVSGIANRLADAAGMPADDDDDDDDAPKGGKKGGDGKGGKGKKG